MVRAKAFACTPSQATELEVPEHPAITRRAQFKVKSVIKEEKLAKKGEGKGKGNAKVKGKGKGGKGKGKGKGKKGCRKKNKPGKGRKSKDEDTTHGPRRKLSVLKLTSSRSLLRKSKRSKKRMPVHPDESVGTQDSKMAKPTDANQGTQDVEDVDLDEPTQTTKQPKSRKEAHKEAGEAPTMDTKKPSSLAGKSAKAKAASRQKPKGKAKAKAKATMEKSARTGSKKNGKQFPSRDQMLQTAEEALQGKFNSTGMKVDSMNVNQPLKEMFEGLMAECQGHDYCDGSCHHFDYLECAAFRFDMYYKRPGFGVRVFESLIHSGDSKKLVSAAYFSVGHCAAANYAAMKIYAARLQSTYIFGHVGLAGFSFFVCSGSCSRWYGDCFIMMHVHSVFCTLVGVSVYMYIYIHLYVQFKLYIYNKTIYEKYMPCHMNLRLPIYWLPVMRPPVFF